MKVLVLGGNGMLGHKLVQILGKSFETWTTIRMPFETFSSFGIFDQDRTIEGVDAMNFETVLNAIEISKPEVVINAIGIVKQKETLQNVIATLTVNSIFPQLLAKVKSDFGFRLISISTDCVFSGKKGYYDEDDPIDAFDLYGQSKHWGEVSGENCLTIRTSIIGRELLSSRSLLEWLIAQNGKSINGYTKAIYSGFPTREFADIIVDILENHPSLSGTYHVSSDPITKFELLTKINDELNLGVTIKEDSNFVIDRSLDSGKFREITGFRPKNWERMIKSLATDITPYDRWKMTDS